MKLAVAYATDVGRVREGNEDNLLVDEHLGVFAVADGMGGHRGGEVASSTAVEALRAAIAAGQTIDAAITTANTAVIERASGDPTLTGMGTTLTALHPLAGTRLLIGHVGDSRAYRLRDGELERLTEDHSLVEELVRDGRITREQAEVHPQRNIVTRALGVDADVEIDLLTIAVQTGDRLLICSDGLTSMVREREVARLLGTGDNMQEIAEHLVQKAVDNGGEDNVTVVVIHVLEADPAHDDAALVTDAQNDPSAPEVDGRTAVQPIVATPLASAPSADLAAPPSRNEPIEPTVVSDSELPRRRRRWWRVFGKATLAILPILLVLGAGAVALHWVTYRDYYVGTAHGSVAVFKGDPDGIVSWWNPKLQWVVTGLPVSRLAEASRAQVQAHGGMCHTESRRAVEACVARLQRLPAAP